MQHIAFVLAHPSSGTRMFGSMLESHPSIKFFFEQCKDDMAFYYHQVKEAEDKNLCYVYDLKYQFVTQNILSWITLHKPSIFHLVRINLLELASAEMIRLKGEKTFATFQELFYSQNMANTKMIWWHHELITMNANYLPITYEHLVHNESALVMDKNIQQAVERHLQIPEYEDDLLCRTTKLHGDWRTKICLIT